MVNLVFISTEFVLELVESLDLACNGGFWDISCFMVLYYLCSVNLKGATYKVLGLYYKRSGWDGIQDVLNVHQKTKHVLNIEVCLLVA